MENTDLIVKESIGSIIKKEVQFLGNYDQFKDERNFEHIIQKLEDPDNKRTRNKYITNKSNFKIYKSLRNKKEHDAFNEHITGQIVCRNESIKCRADLAFGFENGFSIVFKSNNITEYAGLAYDDFMKYSEENKINPQMDVEIIEQSVINDVCENTNMTQLFDWILEFGNIAKGLNKHDFTRYFLYSNGYVGNAVLSTDNRENKNVDSIAYNSSQSYAMYSVSVGTNYIIIVSGSYIASKGNLISNSITILKDEDGDYKINAPSWDYVYDKSMIPSLIYSDCYCSIIHNLSVIKELVERKEINVHTQKIYNYKAEYESKEVIVDGKINYKAYDGSLNTNPYYPIERKSPRCHYRKATMRFNPKTGVKDIPVRGTIVNKNNENKMSYGGSSSKPSAQNKVINRESVPEYKEKIETQIIELYESRKYKYQKDIAAALGVSNSKVSTVLKEYKASDEKEGDNEMGRRQRRNTINKISRSANNHQKSKQYKQQYGNIVSDDNIEIKSNSLNNTKKNILSSKYGVFGIDKVEGLSLSLNNNNLECGLVADRHDMKCKENIFITEINQSLMFDYKEQEKIVEDFIDSHNMFDENGICNKNLVVYVTGIQCALGSLCKVAYKKKVNLILKHYNSQLKNYGTHVIYSFVPSIIDESFHVFDKLYKDRTNVLYYNCTCQDFKTEDNLYAITLSKYTSTGESNNLAVIILKEFDDIWKIYPVIISAIQSNSSEKLGVFVASAKIINGIFQWGDGITKGYNFK